VAPAARKRVIPVCDPVRGLVSPTDIRRWLLATGWKRDRKTRHFHRGKAGIWDPMDDSSVWELERLITDLGHVTKRSPGGILRAIVAHARGGPAVDALPPAVDPTAELAQLRAEVAATNPPLVTCGGCGFEWDGRSAPPATCPSPGPDDYDHDEMVEMWVDIQASGLVRGADELPEEFKARMAEWDEKRP
jgi:hypothetical protein